MSVIIIREKGANKIDSSLLRRLVSETGEGWGITYFNKDGVGFTRDINMRTFTKNFRERESKDLKMVVHLNEAYTGSKCLGNVQPFYISPEIGIVTIEGWISKYPDEIQPFFPNSNIEKSDEVVIGEYFKKFCLERKGSTTINNWNRFLIEKSKFLSNFNIVLMMRDGTILNNMSETGYYQDKNRLWFSNLKGINLDTYDRILTIDEACESFDKYSLINLENLRNITQPQIEYLCEQYPYGIGELIKFGVTGYDFDEENPIYSPEDSDSQLEREECCDCQEQFNMDLLTGILVNNEEKYICQGCIIENGVKADEIINDINFSSG